MNNNPPEITYPIVLPAISVMQPLGEFFITKISAEVLLDVTFADPLRIAQSAQGTLSYLLKGGQRREDKLRLVEIGKFIESSEAAFPNSIILGANYNEEGNLVEEESRRWRVESSGSKECLSLVIPSREKLASIVDGQHRLDGFAFTTSDRRKMELLCAVYLDLPNPYQAYIFATINFNQKKVSRSQAYELFAFDLENEPPQSWSPDKTAVYITRRLNTEIGSPLYGRVLVVAQDSDILFQASPRPKGWAVSMATVVDGVLRLFSAKPKQDKYLIDQKQIGNRSRLEVGDDDTPLRDLYRETNDLAIYTAVKNFFIAVDRVFWANSNSSSYITKTVGIQALLDVLYSLMKPLREEKDISVDFIVSRLASAGDIDFSAERIQASGIGRAQIRREILERIGLSA